MHTQSHTIFAQLSSRLLYFVFIIVTTVVVSCCSYICETVTLVFGFTYKWPTTTEYPFMCRKRKNKCIEYTVRLYVIEKIESSICLFACDVLLYETSTAFDCALHRCFSVARWSLTFYRSLVYTIRLCHTWTTNSRMPAVIHILFCFRFFLSFLLARSLTCSLAPYYLNRHRHRNRHFIPHSFHS